MALGGSHALGVPGGDDVDAWSVARHEAVHHDRASRDRSCPWHVEPPTSIPQRAERPEQLATVDPPTTRDPFRPGCVDRAIGTSLPASPCPAARISPAAAQSRMRWPRRDGRDRARSLPRPTQYRCMLVDNAVAGANRASWRCPSATWARSRPRPPSSTGAGASSQPRVRSSPRSSRGYAPEASCAAALARNRARSSSERSAGERSMWGSMTVVAFMPSLSARRGASPRIGCDAPFVAGRWSV